MLARRSPELPDVSTPRPASSVDTRNEYVFERSLEMERPDARATRGYIDCYKRDCFVLETKQGVEKKEREALSSIGREREAKRRKGHGVRGSATWDSALVKARNQAERYARALPSYEGRPPFLIVADVGLRPGAHLHARRPLRVQAGLTAPSVNASSKKGKECVDFSVNIGSFWRHENGRRKPLRRFSGACPA